MITHGAIKSKAFRMHRRYFWFIPIAFLAAFAICFAILSWRIFATAHEVIDVGNGLFELMVAACMLAGICFCIAGFREKL